MARGVKPEQKRLFVIDGSKALRTAMNAVSAVISRSSAVGPRNCECRRSLTQGSEGPSEECVASGLEDGSQSGKARLKKLAEWLGREYPSAAASLLEGLEECFTSTGWTYLLRCIVVWQLPISSRVRIPEFA